MTARFAALLVAALSLLAAALSTGGALYFLFFLLLASAALFSLVSVACAFALSRFSCELERVRVVRGEEAVLLCALQLRVPLPIAPLRLRVTPPGADGEYEADVTARAFGRSVARHRFACPHVGIFSCGVRRVVFRDALGLFSLSKGTGQGLLPLTVLPAVLQEPPLRFSPDDSGDEKMARARDDATSPADVRAYQEGDELRRVHWKLSLRRGTLMVRTFEEPERPDALILMDCSPPAASGETALYMRDALCESAASLASVQLSASHIVRIPLPCARPRELTGDHAAHLPLILEGLAGASFDGTERFERVLMLETRRMRRTGSTAILTTHLSSRIADMIVTIRRMGPQVRLIYVHVNELTPEASLLLTRIECADIEVETVMLIDESEAVHA